LCSGQLWSAAADAALSARRNDAGGSPLADRGAFELSKRADHLHHHAPGRGRGVDVLRDEDSNLHAFRQPILSRRLPISSRAL
jgi:hypothetical protein